MRPDERKTRPKASTVALGKASERYEQTNDAYVRVVAKATKDDAA